MDCLLAQVNAAWKVEHTQERFLFSAVDTAKVI